MVIFDCLCGNEIDWIIDNHAFLFSKNELEDVDSHSYDSVSDESSKSEQFSGEN